MAPVLARLGGLAALALPQTPSFVFGLVSDSLTHEPVAGVVVAVNDRPADTTGDDGRYRIALPGLGIHRIRLTHPRFRPVLEGVTFTIEVPRAGLEKQVDVTWPDLTALVLQACDPVRHGGPVDVLGVVHGARPPGPLDAVVGTDSLAQQARKGRRKEKTQTRFVGTSVPVRANGGFLLCGLPAREQVTLYLKAGSRQGPSRTLRLPIAGYVEITLDPP